MLSFKPQQWAALIILLIILTFILFPMGWLGEQIPAYGLFLGWLFATAREHAIGHSLLFLLLGLMLLLIFPGLRTRPWRYVSIIIVVAIFQETFQLLYKARPLVYDDFRDIATDLLGAALALGIFHIGCLVKRRLQ